MGELVLDVPKSGVGIRQLIFAGPHLQISYRFKGPAVIEISDCAFERVGSVSQSERILSGDGLLEPGRHLWKIGNENIDQFGKKLAIAIYTVQQSHVIETSRRDTLDRAPELIRP